MIVHLGYILLFSSVFVQGDQDESAKTHVGKCEEYQGRIISFWFSHCWWWNWRNSNSLLVEILFK